MRGKQIKMK